MAVEKEEIAIVAGGCFWCMVQPFDSLPGIEKVRSGYTGGHTINPTYEEVSSHTTGHTEAVKIVYDPKKLTYAELVSIYWEQTDPTDAEVEGVVVCVSGADQGKINKNNKTDA